MHTLLETRRKFVCFLQSRGRIEYKRVSQQNSTPILSSASSMEWWHTTSALRTNSKGYFSPNHKVKPCFLQNCKRKQHTTPSWIVRSPQLTHFLRFLLGKYLGLWLCKAKGITEVTLRYDKFADAQFQAIVVSLKSGKLKINFVSTQILFFCFLPKIEQNDPRSFSFQFRYDLTISSLRFDLLYRILQFWHHSFFCFLL